MRRAIPLPFWVGVVVLNVPGGAFAFTIIPPISYTYGVPVSQTGTIVTVTLVDDDDDDDDDESRYTTNCKDCFKSQILGSGGNGWIPNDTLLNVSMSLIGTTPFNAMTGRQSISDFRFGVSESIFGTTIPLNWVTATGHSFSLNLTSDPSELVFTADTMNGDVVDFASDVLDFSSSTRRAIFLIFKLAGGTAGMGPSGFLEWDGTLTLEEFILLSDQLPNVIPEPASLGLLLLGIAGLGVRRSWRRRSASARPSAA